MNNRFVKWIAIVIAALMLLGIATPFLIMLVYGEPQAEPSLQSALSVVQELDSKINAASEKAFQLNQQIAEREQRMAEIQKELEIIEKLEAEQMETYKKRIAATCEQTEFSLLEFILSSTGFADFTERIVIAGEIAEYDKTVLDSMQEIKQEIKQKEEEQENIRVEQETAQKEMEETLASLQEQKEIASSYMQSLMQNTQAYSQYLTEKEEAERAVKNQTGVIVNPEELEEKIQRIPTGYFTWPTLSHRISSEFSPQRVNPVTGELRAHTGADIADDMGNPVYAAQTGRVTLAEENGGYGNCIMIAHSGPVGTLYGHLSAILVSEGQVVEQGQQIGRIGSTGNSTGPHLHFEIMVDGANVDPMRFFR